MPPSHSLRRPPWTSLVSGRLSLPLMAAALACRPPSGEHPVQPAANVPQEERLGIALPGVAKGGVEDTSAVDLADPGDRVRIDVPLADRDWVEGHQDGRGRVDIVEIIPFVGPHGSG